MNSDGTRIYLIRHGATSFNNSWRYQGLIDEGLNDDGRMQAEALEDYFMMLKLDAIYSSPLRRAKQTAAPIAATHDLSIREVPGLEEMNFGAWEGLTFNDIRGQYPELARVWHHAPHLAQPPDGEPLERAGKRAGAAFKEIAHRHVGEQVAVVAHGGINRLLLCQLLGIDYTHLRQFRQDNGALNLIDVYDNISILSLLNYRP